MRAPELLALSPTPCRRLSPAPAQAEEPSSPREEETEGDDDVAEEESVPGCWLRHHASELLAQRGQVKRCGRDEVNRRQDVNPFCVGRSE